jgi:phosphate transport system protein
MSRERFEQEMGHLQEQVLALGTIAERAVRTSVEVLVHQDLDGARKLIDDDHLINERRFELENEILTIIATQQPLAGDLRKLASSLELVGELERIADYAKGIANVALMIGAEPLVKPLVDIPLMAERACGMLSRALEAFSRWDVDLARAVPKEDTEVDVFYERIYRDLAAVITRDPRTLDQAIRLSWVAHNLERVADRVSNLCERVVFAVQGRMEELAAP